MNLSPLAPPQSPPDSMDHPRSSILHPRSSVTAPEGRATRLGLILEVRELYRQGNPRPVETVLSRHPDAMKLESLVFDLIHEEYHQRSQDGQLSDPKEFGRRFSEWGLDFGEFIATKDLLENHRHFLTDPEDPAWPDPDQPFLNFHLLGELGRGTFARVYLALEPALGDRPVVLKVSKKGAAEANTLGRLDHPNIVPVYSVHHDPTSQLTAVCMPYLGSATLEDVRTALLLRQSPPRSAQMIWQFIQDPVAPEFLGHARKTPPAWLHRGSYVNAVLHLGRQLAQALAFVHERGIFHRDLKPSNVLMTPDGRPMLLDFNLSRHREVPDHKAAGTIPYMPPELLAAVHPDNRNDSPRLIDERSDLFSLGVILYELLTGAYPFGSVPRHENLKEVGARWFEQQKAGPMPLREKNPRVDAGVARIIESCLAFDPGVRPRNAPELEGMLRRQLSPWGRARRWAGLHRPFVVTSIVLGLAAVTATAGVLIPKAPYGVRQLHQGWDLYKQGRYEEAIEYLNRAIDADPADVEARYARGRAFQRRGQIEPAIADFEVADRLTHGEDGRIKASLGFCRNLLGVPDTAIVNYKQAQDLDFVSAELLNNMGYSYMEWKSQTKPENRLDQAGDLLSRALKLNDRLQAAYYNRARLALLSASQDSRFVPSQGLADIRKAIELGPVSAPLFWDAARLSCLVAEEDPLQKVETFHYLNKAVDYGLDPKQLERDFLFQVLRKDVRFEALIQKSWDPDRFQKATRLVDPIQD